MFSPAQVALWPFKILEAMADTLEAPDTLTSFSEDELCPSEEYSDEVNYEDQEFDEWLEAQSQERTQLAAVRALKTLEWDIEPVAELADLEDKDLDAFGQAILIELGQMYVADTMSGLVRDGYVEAQVREDSEIGYTITPAGEEAFVAANSNLVQSV